MVSIRVSMVIHNALLSFLTVPQFSCHRTTQFLCFNTFTDQLPVTAHVDQCPLSSSVLRVVENIDTLLLQGRRSSIFQTIPMSIKLSFNNPDVVPSVNNFKRIILAMA